MAVTYSRPNDYKGSNTTYRFDINLANPVDSKGKLYINFTNHWNLYKDNCTILGGIKPLPDKNITCSKL